MKTAEEVAEMMYGLIVEGKGKRKYSAKDLQTAATAQFGAEVDRAICKAAVRVLTDSGRCTYSMYGGVSYVESV